MSRHMHSIDIARNVADLRQWGLSLNDIRILRQAAARLHDWFELECGTDRGLVQQDEATGIWTMHPITPRGYDVEGYVITNREAYQRRRIDRIMSRYPTLAAYIQTDPRGCPVYICRKADARADRYTHGCPIIV